MHISGCKRHWKSLAEEINRETQNSIYTLVSKVFNYNDYY